MDNEYHYVRRGTLATCPYQNLLSLNLPVPMSINLNADYLKNVLSPATHWNRG